MPPDSYGKLPSGKADSALAWGASAEPAESLRREHLVFSTLEACPVGVTIADASKPGFPLIYANRMFLRMTGYDQDDVLGRSCSHLQGPETDPDAVVEMRRALAAGVRTEVRLVNYRKDGVAFLNRLVLEPIHDDLGRITSYMGSQCDVTLEAKYRMEAQRQKMEALGRMMSSVVHDVKNMLQPMTLLAEHMISKSTIVGEDREQLEMILDSGRQASSMVADLLAFARPTSVAAVIHDPETLLEDALRLVRPILPAGVTLEVVKTGRPPRLAVDRTAFVQVLLNLAANAVAAMDGRGRLTITLDEGVSDPDRPSARLRFIDTGCGMTRATLDRIFEPFFTTKPIGQGTGLGLYAVYGLIEQMDGTISFDSEPGRGTKATITLPGASGDLR